MAITRLSASTAIRSPRARNWLWPVLGGALLAASTMILIRAPDARDDTLLTYVQGPDFPTGGVCVEDRESLIEAYATGRGGFRVRAR